MKLVLDLRHPKLPKLFWVVLLFTCLAVIIRQLPASWVSESLATQTGCRVILQQPTGSIWNGSAALAFSESNATTGRCRDPLSVTERFYWSSSCKLFSMTCSTEIQFPSLEQVQRLTWGLGKLQIAANEIKLPANILEGLGNPWSTLRPRGELSARWTDINLQNSGNLEGASPINGTSSGVIRIIISDLSSPISPVKPLGGYEILANIAEGLMTWSLSTTSGPLLLKGQGELSNKVGSKEVHFSGEANACLL